MTLLKFFKLNAFCLLLNSCSTNTVAPEKPTNYSSSTQYEFEAIEKGNFGPSSRPLIESKPIINLPAPSITVPPDIEVETQTAQVSEIEPTKTSSLSSKGQERLQEINQNLAFYCMRHRKDGLFSSEEKCIEYTNTILNNCEKKHKIINSVLLKCIKSRLKKH